MNNLFGIELESKLSRIIDYFVKFYGEEYRELVVERMLNLDMNFYGNPFDINAYLVGEKKELINGLAKAFLERLGLEPTNELIRITFENCSSFDYCPIDYVYRLTNENSLQESQILHYEHVFNSMLEKLEKEIGSENTKRFVEALKQNVSFFQLMKEEEFAFYERNKEIYQEIDKIQATKAKETKLANIEFLLEFKDMLTEHDRILLKKAQDGQELQLRFLDCSGILISTSCIYESAIDSFSTDSEEKLNNGNQYLENNVKQSRIEYFKALGIDLGTDYKKYEEAEECKRVRPSFELADKIVEKRKELKKKVEIKCIKESKEFQAIKEKVNSIPLQAADGFSIQGIRESGSYISANYILEDGTPKMKPIMYFCYTNMPYFSDVLLNHELNHAMEFQLLDVNGNTAHYLSGFDYLESKTDELPNDDTPFSEKPRRKFELINEVINHLIAEDITKMMHSDGFYMLSKQNNARILGACSTSFGNRIIRPFYERYRKEIIASRLTGNMDILYEAVGKDNFLALNEQVNELFTLDKNALRRDEKQDLDTTTTRKYSSIVGNTKEIYLKMKEHSASKALN